MTERFGSSKDEKKGDKPMATIPPIDSSFLTFKAAADSLLDEVPAATPQKLDELLRQDAEIRRRWKVAHGGDDGLTLGTRLRDVL